MEYHRSIEKVEFKNFTCQRHYYLVLTENAHVTDKRVTKNSCILILDYKLKNFPTTSANFWGFSAIGKCPAPSITS
jgi:hypothetical protein